MPLRMAAPRREATRWGRARRAVTSERRWKQGEGGVGHADGQHPQPLPPHRCARIFWQRFEEY